MSTANVRILSPLSLWMKKGTAVKIYSNKNDQGNTIRKT
jgi:hypothetical protein